MKNLAHANRSFPSCKWAFITPIYQKNCPASGPSSCCIHRDPTLFAVSTSLPFILSSPAAMGLLPPLKGHQGHQLAAQPNLKSTLLLLATLSSIWVSFLPHWLLLLLFCGTFFLFLTSTHWGHRGIRGCFSSISSLHKCLNLVLIYILLIPTFFFPALNSRLTSHCLSTSPLECPADMASFLGIKEPLGNSIPSSHYALSWAE